MIDLDNDLLALTKFKNLRLYSYIRANATIEAKKIGIAYATLLGYASLRLSPLSTTGGYKRGAKKIAEYYGEIPEVLFPASLYALKLPKQVERSLESAELLPLLSASGMTVLPMLEERIDQGRMEVEIRYSLNKLSPTEQKVLGGLYGLNGEPQTHRKIAEDLGLTASRIQQIEVNALKSLRKRRNNKNLLPFVTKSLADLKEITAVHMTLEDEAHEALAGRSPLYEAPKPKAKRLSEDTVVKCETDSDPTDLLLNLQRTEELDLVNMRFQLSQLPSILKRLVYVATTHSKNVWRDSDGRFYGDMTPSTTRIFKSICEELLEFMDKSTAEHIVNQAIAAHYKKHGGYRYGSKFIKPRPPKMDELGYPINKT